MTSSIVFDCQHQYSSGFSLNACFETNGQLTALSGPSGSGKTTIVSLLAGLMKPTSGRIQIGDDVVTDTRTGIFVRPDRRRVGLLFQDHCLFPHLRVKSNIAYGMRRRRGQGVPLDRILKTLELEDLLDRYPRSLSGGQQQRVALARAIASAPQILLLDEPLTSIHASLSERIASFIERVVDEFKIPTLLVSHNHVLIEQLAHHVLTIEDGVIRSTQTTDCD